MFQEDIEENGSECFFSEHCVYSDFSRTRTTATASFFCSPLLSLLFYYCEIPLFSRPHWV